MSEGSGLITAPTPTELVAEWRAGVARLDPARIPAPGMIHREPGANGREGVWGAVLEMMRRFLDAQAEEAAALGWGTTDLFGVHRAAGAMRVDSVGALVSVYPRRIVSITATEIVTARRGSRSTDRRMTNPAESIPIWDFRMEGR